MKNWFSWRLRLWRERDEALNSMASLNHMTLPISINGCLRLATVLMTASSRTISPLKRLLKVYSALNTNFQKLPFDSCLCWNAYIGLLSVFQDILDLRFSEVESPHTWHRDVRMFVVHDKSSQVFLGHFYLGKYTWWPRPVFPFTWLMTHSLTLSQ